MFQVAFAAGGRELEGEQVDCSHHFQRADWCAGLLRAREAAVWRLEDCLRLEVGRWALAICKSAHRGILSWRAMCLTKAPFTPSSSIPTPCPTRAHLV